MQVDHEPNDRGGTFTLTEDGRRLGELTYRVRGDVRVIDHTWVDPAARGKGAAGRLMEAAVEVARAEGWKLDATCSYAVWSLDEHPEWSDVRGE